MELMQRYFDNLYPKVQVISNRFKCTLDYHTIKRWLNANVPRQFTHKYGGYTYTTTGLGKEIVAKVVCEGKINGDAVYCAIVFHNSIRIYLKQGLNYL
ncbi:hypothetical protein PUW25_26015 (plasmid) [Paenibacillus urinalis]|uniref:Uncharacterized protein n=1 Tax=Paenibacillus urinalis TaxID=521520 RepID=A0ABY7XGW8_9BACL|nr:hypothetical protein [Paenibacillus urinalis]WDI05027.1 hypothetical protein PUW25_26015 [Paenibacillus urinalis]